jgi:hypothetical protein
MEIVDILRVLWRRRLLVLIGTPAAMLLVLVGTHRLTLSPPGLAPAPSPTGLASAAILLDTPSSQIVDLHAPGATALEVRSDLLSSLLASAGARSALARHAGLRSDQIDLSPFVIAPALSSPLARRVAELDAAANRAYVVRVNVDPVQPLVAITATAPDAATARRLAQATVDTLAQLAAPNGTAGTTGYVVKPLGAPRAITVFPGKGRAKTAALGFMTALFWLVGIVFATGLARAWRRAGDPAPLAAA